MAIWHPSTGRPAPDHEHPRTARRPSRAGTSAPTPDRGLDRRPHPRVDLIVRVFRRFPDGWWAGIRPLPAALGQDAHDRRHQRLLQTGTMAIDLGLDDPAAMEAMTRAILIVDDAVDRLRDEIGDVAYTDDCEVYRLTRALPRGPLSLDRTILAAVDAARGSFDQISYILRHNLPTSMIVLQALLRSALVGSARVVFALLPANPSTRLQNAKVLVAQEGKSFMQALDCYTGFEQLAGLRPDAEYLATARQQNTEIQDGRRPPGDGVVMNRAADVVAEALAAAPEYRDESRQQLREHVVWLWNTYSGLAHTHAWPRLLPGSGQDPRVPGDFPGDFYMIATIAQIAMVAFKCRSQPGSANTTDPVPLGPEPPNSR